MNGSGAGTIIVKFRRMFSGEEVLPQITAGGFIDTCVPGRIEDPISSERSCVFRFQHRGTEINESRCISVSANPHAQTVVTVWYECGGGGSNGDPAIRTRAFNLPHGYFLTPTPIASVSSGEWPFRGNEYRVGTGDSATEITAVERIGGIFNTFQEWRIFGGAAASGLQLTAPKGVSSLAIALNGRGEPIIPDFRKFFVDLIPEIAQFSELFDCLADPACDPSPVDLIRFGKTIGVREASGQASGAPDDLTALLAVADQLDVPRLSMVLVDLNTRMGRLKTLHAEIETVLQKRKKDK